MSRIAATFDPSAVSTDTFNAGFPNGTGRMVVWNESNINLILSWGAFSTYCPAWTAMLYCVSTNDVNINWTQQSTLQVYNPPISQVQVEVFNDNETIVGTFPAALHRQTATSLVGNTETTFSATIGFGSTATKYQALNIYNPANSGVSYTFHSARVLTNDSTLPACNLIVLHGADLNLGTPVSAVPHTGSGTPPVSTAHCTAEDQVEGHGGTIIEVLDQQAGITQDFLAFPDSYTLAPGNNLYLQLTSGTTTHVVRLTLKWSENTAIPSSSGVSTMPPLIAATLVNDGSPASTGLIEATPSGDSSSAVYLDVAGNLTLGNGTHKGSISTDNNLINSDTNGNLAVGGSVKTNTIRDNTSGTDLIDLTSTQIKLNQKLALILGSLTRIATVGQTTIANAGTSVTHALGATPDFVLPIHDAGGASADVITVNYGTMNTTTFTAYSSNAGGTGNIRFILFKFT